MITKGCGLRLRVSQHLQVTFAFECSALCEFRGNVGLPPSRRDFIRLRPPPFPDRGGAWTYPDRSIVRGYEIPATDFSVPIGTGQIACDYPRVPSWARFSKVQPSQRDSVQNSHTHSLAHDFSRAVRPDQTACGKMRFWANSQPSAAKAALILWLLRTA
jgi:hypothetical protein